jgi:hypothetical protein
MGTCGGGQPRNYIANKKEQGGRKKFPTTHAPSGGKTKRSSARRATTTTTTEEKKMLAELIFPGLEKTTENNKMVRDAMPCVLTARRSLSV